MAQCHLRGGVGGGSLTRVTNGRPDVGKRPPPGRSPGDDGQRDADRPRRAQPRGGQRPADRPSDDHLLDDYRALNDPDRRREVERRGDYFIVEGRLPLEALVASSYTIRSVLVTEHKAQAVAGLVGDRAPLVVRPETDLAAIAGFPFHRGVLASANRPKPELVRDVVVHARTALVLEGVNDHENLGALFRNAAALGADAVLLDPTTADPLYRRSVRVSMGHVLRVPWARLDGLSSGLHDLRVQGFELVALTPARRAEPIESLAEELAERRATSSRPVRVALLLGAEGQGLTGAALAAADRRARIPLAPGVDSLNVATAAAVALHRLAGTMEA